LNGQPKLGSHLANVLSRDAHPEGLTITEVSPGVIHRLFEQQAAAWPEATAVVCGDHQTTYGQLDRRSNQIARLLRARGVRTGSHIGILLPRSGEVYAVLLGILKAGAAYVPMDPEYPPDRVRYILQDCRARVLITSDALAPRAAGFAGDTVVLEKSEDAIAIQSDLPLDLIETGVTP
jgi:non-ribosomal peptide synthetase component F